MRKFENMAYYICKCDGVFVEWNGLSIYLTKNNPSGMAIKIFSFSWIVVIVFSKMDINFKEFDETNNEIKINLLPLVEMLISVYSSHQQLLNIIWV